MMSAAMLGESGESRVAATTVSPGGYSFQDHVNRGIVANLLKDGSKSWDWVVLQDQSQIPGFGPGNREFDQSLAAVLDLNELAATAGAKTVFLMTWGYRNGDSRNSDLYPNYKATQRELRDGYIRYVQNTSTNSRPTKVAPVVKAYEALFLFSPNPLESQSDFYKCTKTMAATQARGVAI